MISELITGKQVIAARGLLGLSQEDLAKKSNIGITTIIKFEKEDAEPKISTIEAIKNTLMDLGVEFLHGGVIPKRTMVEELYGKDAFQKLKADIEDTLTKAGQEMLFYGIQEDLIDESDELFIKTLKKRKITLKFITRKMVEHFLSSKDYKVLEDNAFSGNPLIIYENKLALMYYNPHSRTSHIILINNHYLAETYKKIFNTLWNIGTKR